METMDECHSLCCSPWLAQLVSLYTPGPPLPRAAPLTVAWPSLIKHESRHAPHPCLQANLVETFSRLRFSFQIMPACVRLTENQPVQCFNLQSLGQALLHVGYGRHIELQA